MEDKELIEQYLNGDERAFERLLGKYMKPLYGFVFQFVRDQAIAEDLTQEAFVRAWKNIRQFDQTKQFKTWLYAIAKNATYDYFKKKKSIPFSSFQNEEGESTLEAVDDGNLLPDELLERKDAVEELDRVLLKLPELYRTILLLAYKEDFSLMEISEIFGIPYNTVKSRHQRAIKALKQEISMDTASKSKF